MIGRRERRAHPRCRIDWPVSLRQTELGRRFTGRGRDLSSGGALVALPLSIPIRPGQRLETRFQPRAKPLPRGTSQQTKARTARVVRVQRASTLLDGLQLVGLMFEQ